MTCHWKNLQTWLKRPGRCIWCDCFVLLASKKHLDFVIPEKSAIKLQCHFSAFFLKSHLVGAIFIRNM